MKDKNTNFDIQLSPTTKKLWGKLANDGQGKYLPLFIHLNDVAEVGKMVVEIWLPKRSKKTIICGISKYPDWVVDEADKEIYARKVITFLAAAHDIGKASPAFQIKARKVGFGDIVDELKDDGLNFKIKDLKDVCGHAMISEVILQNKKLDESYAVTVGAHHGKPPNDIRDLKHIEASCDQTGIGDEQWEKIHNELLQMALDKADLEELPKGKLSLTAQMLVSSIIIVSDWIASGNGFPLLSRDYPEQPENSAVRAHKAWRELGLPRYQLPAAMPDYADLYEKRFGIAQPRPMQINALQVAQSMQEPGLLIIEAPMGEGKTEAALAAAEVFMDKFGLSGIYFALPTQATSDGIFKRIKNWIEKLPRDEQSSIFLAHGKAGFNEDYTGIKLNSNIERYDEESDQEIPERVVVNEWTQGRRKGLLSDFVVGTIDQVLMCGLRQKFLPLRHLGVVNKTVIVDECHAYDSYQGSYLELVLSWLGAYHVPVILLSATLPSKKRQELLEAYKRGVTDEAGKTRKRKSGLNTNFSRKSKELKASAVTTAIVNEKQFNASYPLLSYTCGNEIKEDAPPKSGRRQNVKVNVLNDAVLAETLKELLSDGGCAGIIRNTVRQAQETAEALEQVFGEGTVKLLHSRFISCDRVTKENELRKLLGPPVNGDESNRPEKLIVVGTQVMEQSLDVDFDVLFTDICPMDLLLQRMGRLHRHKRQNMRPAKLQKATCYVLGVEDECNFNRGSEAVYGKYLLLKTNDNLPCEVDLPDDIPVLVEKVYGDMADSENYGENEQKKEVYQEAQRKYDNEIKNKRGKAKAYQIKLPVESSTMIGMLQADMKDKSGKRGEATVRDTDNSLNVIVVMRKNDGRLYTLPWLAKYADMEIDRAISDNMAKVIAGCSVTLPNEFSKNWNIDNVIAELENDVSNDVVLSYLCDECHWLAGELFLVLDENFDTKLHEKTLHYDKKYGLLVKEEG